MPDQYSDSELHKILREQGHEPDFTPRKPAAKRSNEEQQHQAALIKWWNWRCPKFGIDQRMLFSIPNGAGLFGPVTGAILKRTGLRSGVPDLFLAVPRDSDFTHGYLHGLFIEMKAANGVVSPEQEIYHTLLRSKGYDVAVCRSWTEAREAIIKYLNV
jgi:hypothetical protein